MRCVGVVGDDAGVEKGSSYLEMKLDETTSEL